jgi:ring-1,2-phenylacetyl-CoA epoxidase subunit PaaC
MSQRLSEWCGHGPILEQDIALTNIALDILGQSRNFYQYAAQLIGNTNEDQLAYFRNDRDFKNFVLVEQPNGNWANTVAKVYLLAQYQYLYFQQLQQSNDVQLAAIAEKSLKEIAYHLRWSREWVIRLGDGTNESHTYMQNAIEELYRFTNEFFIPTDFEKAGVDQGFAVDAQSIQAAWQHAVQHTLNEATLLSATSTTWNAIIGKNGIHSEHLGYILAEMQHLQRTYPNSDW